MTGAPRIAVVTSTGLRCGIAHYSHELIAGLADHADVTLLGFDPDILRNADRATGDAVIAGLAARLAGFDAVNLQIEWGTLGRGHATVRRRLLVLLEAAPAAVLTLHTVMRPRPPDWRALAALARRGHPIQAMTQLVVHAYDQQFAGRMYRLLARRQSRGRLALVVHAGDDARMLRDRFGLGQVFDHPLSYLPAARIAALRAGPPHPVRERLPPGSHLAGAFGFFGDYKGFDIAIAAMRHLPARHHLAIFGDVHPTAPPAAAQAMAAGLRALCGPDLAGRVHFMGSCDDQTFLSAMLACDAVVVPYRETGYSSASGPATLAVELGCRVIAAGTRALTEFAAYHPERVELFEIGNAAALAECLAHPAPPPRAPGRTMATNVQLYLKALAQACAPGARA